MDDAKGRTPAPIAGDRSTPRSRIPRRQAIDRRHTHRRPRSGPRFTIAWLTDKPSQSSGSPQSRTTADKFASGFIGFTVNFFWTSCQISFKRTDCHGYHQELRRTSSDPSLVGLLASGGPFLPVLKGYTRHQPPARLCGPSYSRPSLRPQRQGAIYCPGERC